MDKIQKLMKVVLGFLNDCCRSSDSVQYVMYGKYSCCCFIFVGEAEIECFYSSPGGEFSRYDLTHGFNQYDYDADFLLISLSEEEKGRLRATCDACVLVKKPFNYLDVLMMYMPFSNPKELSIEEAPTLNNSQAMVLFLRECLDKENPLRKALDCLHSRQTFIDILYERLAPHALPVLWSSLAGQLKKK